MPPFVPLTEALLPRAATLSAAVGWNQVEADWRLFLRHGAMRALDDGEAALAATAAVLPFGPPQARSAQDARLAWISMVLVRPDRRRAGLATDLLRWAVAALHARGTRTIALDATADGRAVYRRLGFRDLWTFSRWQLPAHLAASADVVVRRLVEADWPAVLALDAAGFGAPRAWLLRDFARRRPAAALVAQDTTGTIVGALLGRDGRLGPQLGPLLARDAEVAWGLLGAAPGGAVLDLRDDATGLAARLAAAGAVRKRGFTRMALGADPPGDPARLFAMAGPEFG